MIHTLATLLYKRAAAPEEKPPMAELPPWSWAVLAVNFIIFLPLIIFTSYTMRTIYPVLAMVEDENPPAYEPIPTDESATTGQPGTVNELTEGKPRPVTASLRSTVRALYSQGGWTSSLRGLTCLLAQAFASMILVGIFSAFMPRALASLASLLTSLALVQLSAAWVHIVITPRSEKHFYQRLPPFKRAFDATALPVAIYWLASEIAQSWVPTLVGLALGVNLNSFSASLGGPKLPAVDVDASFAWKGPIIVLASMICELLLQLPAHVALVRVQASLLPVEDDVIVPFDRSFQSRAEPEVVDGKGYASIKDAWVTFSRAAWKRLVILYVKIYVISIATAALMALVIAPQLALMIKNAKPKDPN